MRRAAPGLLIAVALLAGCAPSAGDAPATQSVAEACALVSEGVASLQERLVPPAAGDGGDTDGGDDAGAVSAALGNVGTRLDGLRDRVTEPGVGAVVEDMASALALFTSALDGADDPAALATDDAFVAASERIADAGERFRDLCTAGGGATEQPAG